MGGRPTGSRSASGHRGRFWHLGPPGGRRAAGTYSGPGDCYARDRTVIFTRPSGSRVGVEDQIEVASTVRRQTTQTSRGHAHLLMNQLRLDPLTGRWVVVSTDRATRPQAFAPRAASIQADTSRPVPVLPGQRGARHPDPGDPGRRRELAGPGGPQPLPRLRGQRPVRGDQPGSGLHPGHGGRHPRGDRPLPRPSELVVHAERRADHRGDDRHQRPDRGALDHPRPPLQPGHRQRRPRGRRLHRAPPRPAARDVLRAPGAGRGAGRFRPVRRSVPAVHGGRRRGERQPPGGLRRRAGPGDLPVLERGALRDAGHPEGPRPPPAPQPPGRPGGGGPGPEGGPGQPARRGRATSPTTWSSTPPPTGPPSPTTGTSTWCPRSPRWPGSSWAPA